MIELFDISASEIRLMAGEMTAQEMRTVKAVLAGLKARAFATPPPQPAHGDWVNWRGGVCPVAEYMPVEVVYRSQGMTEMQANKLRWSHTGEWDDVMDYRMTAPTATAPASKVERVSIRRATVTDTGAILALETEVWGEPFLLPYALGALIQFGYVFIAEDAGKLIGFLSAMRTADGDLFVIDLAVIASRRADGISTLLCDQLSAFSGNIISVVDAGNAPALALHAKYGFIEMPDRPVVDGSVTMIQTKRLGDALTPTSPPDDWILVPREPTGKMLDAMAETPIIIEGCCTHLEQDEAKIMYRAMRDAVPTPPNAVDAVAVGEIGSLNANGVHNYIHYNLKDVLVPGTPLYASPQAAPSGWLPISSAPKTGRTLLLGYFNELGNWRTMRGEWISAQEIEETWDDCGGPEEAKELEGWYETSVEADDAPSCWRTSPTYWHLPPAPPTAAPPVEPAK